VSKSKKVIFLVDDDISTLALGKEILESVYTVMTLDSGERMFEVLGKITPDLIVLDIEMPGISGQEALKKLKNNPKSSSIPVIFLTSSTAAEVEVQGFDLGAADYIMKPISPARFKKRIEVCLLIEAQNRELKNHNENLEKIVQERMSEIIGLKNALIETMSKLVEQRDHFTGSHIDRTQHYIRTLIGKLKSDGIYASEMSGIDENLAVLSSQMHDIGKIAITDAILLKPAKLTTDEFEEMKKHTKHGGEIIEKIRSSTVNSNFLEYAMDFALYHHEKWDGTGYPYGLGSEDIPILGRLMAIVDVYDALVSVRPYKEAFSHEDAVEIIRQESGKSFDPMLVKIFEEISNEFEEISKNIANQYDE